MKESYFKSQCGAGLLETLIMSGILIMTVQLMMQVFMNFKRFEKQKHLKLLSLYVKSEINKDVDCATTLDDLGFTCSDGDYVEIAKTAAETLIEIGTPGDLTTYTRVGNRYLVRAKCESCTIGPACSGGIRISVEGLLVTKPHPTNPIRAIKHPIYKTDDWFPLYDKVPFMCGF
ncbi:MAG: hypothetical protein AB8G05_04495 [Oligoflexales bacterium]